MVQGSYDLHLAADEDTRRVLEVALVGGHHFLLVGPAGSGKSRLVRALPGLLPPLREEEVREVGAIYGRASELRFDRGCPPIRIPSPASTLRGFLGFGKRPGEVELAHRGILVLDDLPEFRRGVLGALRQPIEEGVLRVARPGERGPRPAAITLFAAMRACPCGGLEGHGEGCACARAKIVRHRRRAWEPLGYLFDLQCEIGFNRPEVTSGSAAFQTRIVEAREIAWERFGDGRVNARMTEADLARFCPLDRAGQALQGAAFEQLGITPGIFGRILRVARTVADLAGADVIRSAHLAEALSYRSLLLPGPFLEGARDGKRPMAL